MIFSFCAIGREITIRKRSPVLHNYPCTQCHRATLSRNLKPDIKSRQPENHKTLILKHMPEVTNCYLCHNNRSSNELHLLEGQSINYDQSAQLCSQCHGIEAADWREGLHGAQRGSWKFDAERLSCVECHNPHHPTFPQYRALPPPKRRLREK
ncbi:MAG: hypothetical protein HYS98_04075 [Deltaproteobacteria bacterium]|nr:hypothetical protein [Deltaproteobacteria bacterium]